MDIYEKISSEMLPTPSKVPAPSPPTRPGRLSAFRPSRPCTPTQARTFPHTGSSACPGRLGARLVLVVPSCPASNRRRSRTIRPGPAGSRLSIGGASTSLREGLRQGPEERVCWWCLWWGWWGGGGGAVALYLQPARPLQGVPGHPQPQGPQPQPPRPAAADADADAGPSQTPAGHRCVRPEAAAARPPLRRSRASRAVPAAAGPGSGRGRGASGRAGACWQMYAAAARGHRVLSDSDRVSRVATRISVRVGNLDGVCKSATRIDFRVGYSGLPARRAASARWACRGRRRCRTARTRGRSCGCGATRTCASSLTASSTSRHPPLPRRRRRRVELFSRGGTSPASPPGSANRRGLSGGRTRTGCPNACVCARVCPCACFCACVRASERASVCVCVCVCVFD